LRGYHLRAGLIYDWGSFQDKKIAIVQVGIIDVQGNK
jgi:hypothetical protein